MKTLKSTQELGPVVPNIATLLRNNVGRFADKVAYQEKHNGKFEGITWKDLYANINTIANNLKKFGFSRGDKMVFFSKNRQEMLELELAVMAMGGISVPIFANFIKETAELLIAHSDAKFAAVSGDMQLNRISPELNLDWIFSFNEFDNKNFQNCLHFSVLKEKAEGNALNFDIDPNEICLNMFTSGTMGLPKCVQLTHRNILSQQAALSQLWNINENDVFLSYLPWHHSFGGIFEKFTALYNGATLSLESGYGKDPLEIFENWKLVQPTVFFSIPKVYEALFQLTQASKEAEGLFFHGGLKFIFTAAASLPQKLSDEFEKRGIPVIEGWGLTETSPCCTITNPEIKREPGVVGIPIPGVEIRLDEEGEIQVKGPNVMVEYYKNPQANKNIFTSDGWFCTGDLGEITPTGLKLLTRKDRIFKLSNGEKVVPTDLEKVIEQKCHYIAYALVAGSGQDYPVALLFPRKELLDNPGFEITPLEGCFVPRDIDDLGSCLRGCLSDANCSIGQKFAKIKAAIIVDDELSVEKNTLTPSMKMSPKTVEHQYRIHMANLYGSEISMDDNSYLINLDPNQDRAI